MAAKGHPISTSLRLDRDLLRRVDQKLSERKYADGADGKATGPTTFVAAVHEALEQWLTQKPDTQTISGLKQEKSEIPLEIPRTTAYNDPTTKTALAAAVVEILNSGVTTAIDLVIAAIHAGELISGSAGESSLHNAASRHAKTASAVSHTTGIDSGGRSRPHKRT